MVLVLFPEKQEMKRVKTITHLDFHILYILNKGYSIVKSDNKVIKNVNDVKKDDLINITLSKGTINAKVMEVNK